MNDTAMPADKRKSPLPDSDQLKSKASELAEKAKQSGEEQLEVGKNKAADQTQDLAGAFEQVSASPKLSLKRHANHHGHKVESPKVPNFY